MTRYPDLQIVDQERSLFVLQTCDRYQAQGRLHNDKPRSTRSSCVVSQRSVLGRQRYNKILDKMIEDGLRWAVVLLIEEGGEEQGY